MQLINGRTPEQWRAFDRWKLIVALVLAAVLVVGLLAVVVPVLASFSMALPLLLFENIPARDAFWVP